MPVMNEEKYNLTPSLFLFFEDPTSPEKIGTGSLHACPERSRRMERGSGVS